MNSFTFQVSYEIRDLYDDWILWKTTLPPLSIPLKDRILVSNLSDEGLHNAIKQILRRAERRYAYAYKMVRKMMEGQK